jgi:phosphoserine aminotransferase
VYYFAPQKCFAADGGLWVALLSPAALTRVAAIKAAGRWVPASLDLAMALDNARADQTYNTPALATLFLFVHQVEWLNAQGGLDWAVKRCEENAAVVYGWAEASGYARPFVAAPAERSSTVATVDLDATVDAAAVAAALRANGVLDTEPYRKLGRNQLRIALFPAIDPEDLRTLTRAIDHLAASLRARG